MTTYAFALFVEGVDILTGPALDALYEAGLDDASVSGVGTAQLVEVDRDARSLAEAVTSAIRQVEGAVRGARVARVEADELVSQGQIAERTGRTRESLRLLEHGERGPGGYPSAAVTDGRTRLWRWAEVAAWFTSALGAAVPATPVAGQETLDAVNGALLLRRATGTLAPNDRAVVEQLLRSTAA